MSALCQSFSSRLLAFFKDKGCLAHLNLIPFNQVIGRILLQHFTVHNRTIGATKIYQYIVAIVINVNSSVITRNTKVFQKDGTLKFLM